MLVIICYIYIQYHQTLTLNSHVLMAETLALQSENLFM